MKQLIFILLFVASVFSYGLNQKIETNGRILVYDTTSSTSYTTVSLVLSGGFGIAGNAVIGADSTKGVVLKSADGTAWRLKVSNAGAVSAVTFP